MHRFASRLAARACAAGVALAAFAASAAQVTVLHVFGGRKDGDRPSAPMIADAAGNLYGTTTAGGARGGGTVFRLVPSAAGEQVWSEEILFSFDGVNGIGQSATGTAPRSALWFGTDGSLFGTTSSGSPVGAGNVFQLLPPAPGTTAWKQSVVYTFSAGAADGAFPEGAAVRVGNDGTRFGTTLGGGPANEGTIYAIRPSATASGAWEESLVATFDSPSDGGGPINDLVADGHGNLYGTATVGGAFGWGAVYQLTAPAASGGTWTKKVIYSFTSGRDGRNPANQLAIDADGVLWGAIAAGGVGLQGSIFTLTPPAAPTSAWTFRIVHNFRSDGAQAGLAPSSGLVSDGHGAFYGVTGNGGALGCGTVYRFAPSRNKQRGVLTTLHEFTGGDGGAFPAGNLVLVNGSLFGTTFGSTSSDGDPCDGAGIAFTLAP